MFIARSALKASRAPEERHVSGSLRQPSGAFGEWFR